MTWTMHIVNYQSSICSSKGDPLYEQCTVSITDLPNIVRRVNHDIDIAQHRLLILQNGL